ncbi:hypothetical protein [Roseiarcus sp.]
MADLEQFGLVTVISESGPSLPALLVEMLARGIDTPQHGRVAAAVGHCDA